MATKVKSGENPLGHFAGSTREGLRDGKGTYAFQNRFFTYEGEWVAGVMHGEGVLRMASGQSYEGTFVEGEMTGFGLRRYADGSTISGQFEMGEAHGHCTFVAATGESYEGAYQGNVRHGEGLLVKADGERYEGQFIAHKRTGHGRSMYSSGSEYDGGWVANERSGEGVMRYHDGGVFDGVWAADSQAGHGTYTHAENQYTYSGEWAQGVPTTLADRTSVRRWVPPAYSLRLVRVIAVPEGREQAAAEADGEDPPAVNAPFVRVTYAATQEGHSSSVQTPPALEAAHTGGLAWDENSEGRLQLALPAGSVRPVQLQVDLHDATAEGDTPLATAVITLPETDVGTITTLVPRYASLCRNSPCCTPPYQPTLVPCRTPLHRTAPCRPHQTEPNPT